MAKTLLIVLLLISLSPLTMSSWDGIRVELSYIDSKGNFTTSELIRRAVDRSMTRSRRFLSQISTINVTSPVHVNTASYLMELAIGTPPLNFTAIVDTGSDLIWTQCQPCVKCFPQSSPLYPSNSSTFSKIQCNSTLCQAFPRPSCSADCNYLNTYGDGSSTRGYLATETFTFGSTTPVAVPGIGFGCGTQNIGDIDNSSGMVGLGRGPLSLVSQLGISRFSYCFTSFDDTSTSPLLLGSLANLSGNATKSTKFVKNPTADPMSSFYYLSLQGITVGKKLLSIPPSTFQLNQDGNGGFIIDSGTTITALEETAFIPFMLEFRSQMNLSVADGSSIGLNLCFSIPAGMTDVDIPKVIFHFDGADMELPPENLMVKDPATSLLCLFMVGTRGKSTFGNYQEYWTKIALFTIFFPFLAYG